MKKLEIIVEEESMQAALESLMPKILEGRAQWKSIKMRNKMDLIKKLPDRLRAYKRRINDGENLKIVVLLDQDKDDCVTLKNKLEQIAQEAGLSTKSYHPGQDDFQVVNRIVVEELEAWFMGDVEALKKAFSSLNRAKFPSHFNNPDQGGTWERLYRFLKKQGIYRSSYPKVKAARKIAPHIDPHRNRSRSFHAFCRGVEACL